MKKTLTITSLVAAMSMSVFAAQPTQTHVNQAFVQEATQTQVNAPVDNQTAVPTTTVTTANTAAPAMKAPVAGAPAKATKTTAPAVKTPVASAPVKATKTTAPAVKTPVASAPAKATKATAPVVTAPATPKAATSATREDAETMDTAHAMNVPNADEVRVVKHDTGLAVKDVEDATTVNKAQAPKEAPAKKATSADKVTK